MSGGRTAPVPNGVSGRTTSPARMWASACRHAGDCEAMDDAHDAEFEAQQLGSSIAALAVKKASERVAVAASEKEKRDRSVHGGGAFSRAFLRYRHKQSSPLNSVSEASDGDSSEDEASATERLKRRAVGRKKPDGLKGSQPSSPQSPVNELATHVDRFMLVHDIQSKCFEQTGIKLPLLNCEGAIARTNARKGKVSLGDLRGFLAENGTPEQKHVATCGGFGGAAASTASPPAPSSASSSLRKQWHGYSGVLGGAGRVGESISPLTVGESQA